jgi:hypothetical protein
MSLDRDEAVGLQPTHTAGAARTGASDHVAPAHDARPDDSPDSTSREVSGRPLFAEGPHAATLNAARARRLPADDTGSFTGEQRSIGAGNGRLPASWGPDPDTSTPGRGPTGPDEGVPGRTWLSLAVVIGVVLVLVVSVVVAFNLGRGGPGDDDVSTQDPSQSASEAPAASTRVAIAGIRDFDPQGDPNEENPDLAGLAIDRNPSTAWRTNTYYDPISELKSGVGLLVDLGSAKKVGNLRLSLLGSGTSVEVLAGAEGEAAPTSTEDLTRVASADKAGTDVELKLRKPVTTRWLAVWLTALPSVPGGYQGRVAEISVRS